MRRVRRRRDGRRPEAARSAGPWRTTRSFRRGGNGLTGTAGTGMGWAVGNCAIAMPAVTGTGGNGLRAAEIENVEIAATGLDPMAGNIRARTRHIRAGFIWRNGRSGASSGISISRIEYRDSLSIAAGSTPAGFNADSNRWQNVTIPATHGFAAAAGSNNVLDNVVVLRGILQLRVNADGAGARFCRNAAGMDGAECRGDSYLECGSAATDGDGIGRRGDYSRCWFRARAWV